MAAPGKGKRTRRRRRAAKKKSTSRFLNIGVAVLIVVLLGYGTFQFFGNEGHNQTTNPSVVQADTNTLESLSIADNQGQEAAEAVPVTDRETRYLGPPTDSASVVLAEAGELGQPTLLWFHADW